MQRERKDTRTHIWVLHTKTESNRLEQQTEIQKGHDSYSPSVSHCKSQLSVLPPSRCPSLQSCVDIRLVQKGSAQLIAGPLRVGGGVLRGETWVGGGGDGCGCVSVCGNSGSGTRRLTLLPQIWRSGVRWSRTSVCCRETWLLCLCACVYVSIFVCQTLCAIFAKTIITFRKIFICMLWLTLQVVCGNSFSRCTAVSSSVCAGVTTDKEKLSSFLFFPKWLWKSNQFQGHFIL